MRQGRTTRIAATSRRRLAMLGLVLATAVGVAIACRCGGARVLLRARQHRGRAGAEHGQRDPAGSRRLHLDRDARRAAPPRRLRLRAVPARSGESAQPARQLRHRAGAGCGGHPVGRHRRRRRGPLRHGRQPVHRDRAGRRQPGAGQAGAGDGAAFPGRPRPVGCRWQWHHPARPGRGQAHAGGAGRRARCSSGRATIRGRRRGHALGGRQQRAAPDRGRRRAGRARGRVAGRPGPLGPGRQPRSRPGRNRCRPVPGRPRPARRAPVAGAGQSPCPHRSTTWWRRRTAACGWPCSATGSRSSIPPLARSSTCTRIRAWRAACPRKRSACWHWIAPASCGWAATRSASRTPIPPARASATWSTAIPRAATPKPTTSAASTRTRPATSGSAPRAMASSATNAPAAASNTTATRWARRSPAEDQGRPLRVYALAAADPARLWVATNLGAFLYEPATRRAELLPHGPGRADALPDRHVRAVVAARDGSVWFGTSEGGLARHRPADGSWSHFPSIPGDANSLWHPTVMALREDRDGRLWIGTLDGLNLYDPASDRVRRIPRSGSERHSIAGNRVRAIHQSDDGTIWIGTQTGLSRLDELGADGCALQPLPHPRRTAGLRRVRHPRGAGRDALAVDQSRRRAPRPGAAAASPTTRSNRACRAWSSMAAPRCAWPMANWPSAARRD